MISAARTNMERNALLEEHRKARLRSIAIASLQHDAAQFGPCVEKEQRLEKDVVLAAIRSENPMPFKQYLDAHNWDDVLSPPFIPEVFRDDAEVVLALLELPDFDWESEEFQYSLHADLRGCKQFFMDLCEQVPRALSLATETLQDDKELVLVALLKDPTALEFASSRLQNDKDILIQGLFGHYQINNSNNTTDEREVEINPYPYEAFCKYVGQDNQDIREDKEVALALLSTGKPNSTYRDVLCEFSDEIRADRQVIELAVTLDGLMLEDASEELRADKEIVLKACQNAGRALNHASHDLRLDREIARAACTNDGEAFIFCLEPLFTELAEDEVFMKTVLANEGGRMIISCPTHMQANEEIVLLALQNGLTYDCVPEHKMRSSKEFIIKAISKYPLCYNYLRRRQQHDKDIVRAAIMAGYSKEDEAIYMDDISEMFPEIFAEREVFLYLVENGQKPYYWGTVELDEELQNDKEFMMRICSHDGQLWEYASTALLEDRDIVETCMKTHPLVFEDLSDEFQIANTDLALSYIESAESPDLPHAVIRANREIALAYIPKENEGLDLWEELALYREDADIVKAVVIKTPEQMTYAHTDFKNDRDFCLSIVRQNGLAVKHMSSQWMRDFEFQVAAVAKDVQVLDAPDNFLGQDGEALDLLRFAIAVRDKLELHSVFCKDILCAMDTTRHSQAQDEPTEDEHSQLVERRENAKALESLLQHVSETPILSSLFGFDGSELESIKQVVVSSPAEEEEEKEEPLIDDCALSLLSLGEETGMALKILIADFVGLPRGKELKELRKASVNLTMRGY